MIDNQYILKRLSPHVDKLSEIASYLNLPAHQHNTENLEITRCVADTVDRLDGMLEEIRTSKDRTRTNILLLEIFNVVGIPIRKITELPSRFAVYVSDYLSHAGDIGYKALNLRDGVTQHDN